MKFFIKTIFVFLFSSNLFAFSDTSLLNFPIQDYDKIAFVDINGNLTSDSWWDNISFVYFDSSSPDEMNQVIDNYFSENMLRVKRGNLYGFLNIDDNILIEPKYDKVGKFSEGLASVLISTNPEYSNSPKKWGFINKKGELVIKPKYDQVTEFSEGLAAAVMEYNGKSKVGYISTNGDVFIKPIYDLAYPFFNGLAAVYIKTPYQRNLLSARPEWPFL